MSPKKYTAFPKTQHKRKYDRGKEIRNPYTVLDSPDDRITKQTGDGLTFVKEENPDDIETK